MVPKVLTAVSRLPGVQSRSQEARANWESALESKDRAISQLEEALQSRQRMIDQLTAATATSGDAMHELQRMQQRVSSNFH